jgi:hypothetical protein
MHPLPGQPLGAAGMPPLPAQPLGPPIRPITLYDRIPPPTRDELLRKVMLKTDAIERKMGSKDRTIDRTRVTFPQDAFFMLYPPNYSDTKMRLFKKIPENRVLSPVSLMGGDGPGRPTRPNAIFAKYSNYGWTRNTIKFHGTMRIYIHPEVPAPGSTELSYLQLDNYYYKYNAPASADEVHWWVHRGRSMLFKRAETPILGPDELPVLEFPLLSSLMQCKHPEVKNFPALMFNAGPMDTVSFSAYNAEHMLDVDVKAVGKGGKKFGETENKHAAWVKEAHPIAYANLLFTHFKFHVYGGLAHAAPQAYEQTHILDLFRTFFQLFKHAAQEAKTVQPASKYTVVHFFLWPTFPATGDAEKKRAQYDPITIGLAAMVVARHCKVRLIVHDTSPNLALATTAKDHFLTVWPVADGQHSPETLADRIIAIRSLQPVLP